MILIQHGARLQARSVPGAESRVVMDLTLNGTVITGTWSEETSAGDYAGGVYFGAIQMLAEPTGHRLAGKWVGFGRDFDVNTGAVDAAAGDRATPAGKPSPGTPARQKARRPISNSRTNHLAGCDECRRGAPGTRPTGISGPMMLCMTWRYGKRRPRDARCPGCSGRH